MEKASLELPAGHKNYSEADKEKCPYFQFQKNHTETTSTEIPTEPENKKKQKKDKKPQGGCPFFPDQDKANPSLSEPIEPGFDEKFVSHVQDILDYRGSLKFHEFLNMRKKFSEIPVYLKHSLFHDDETMKKARKIEISQRFFYIDDLKEKGNRNIKKGKLRKSIAYYERALSCLKWMELLEDEELPNKEIKKEALKSDEIEEKKVAEDEAEEKKENNEEDEDEEDDDDDDEDLKEKKSGNPKEEFKFKESMAYIKHHNEEEEKAFYKKYKLFFTVFTDNNTKIVDGGEITEDHEIDMRKSLLVLLYLNMSVVYMKLCNFSVAKQCTEDAEKEAENKSSVVFFRKSQALSLNKEATREQLFEAKELILKAIQMQKTEKVFRQKPEMLKAFGLLGAEEAYNRQLEQIETTLELMEKTKKEDIKGIMRKAKELAFVQSVLKPEKNKQNLSDHMICVDKENSEMKILKIMMSRYYKIIDFYTQANKPENVDAAKKDLQHLRDIQTRMNFYFELNFRKPEAVIIEAAKELSIDMNDPLIVEKCDEIKLEKMIETFDNADFNNEIYHYALKEQLTQEMRKNEKKNKTEKEKDSCSFIPKKKSLLSGIFSMEMIFRIGIILILAFLLYEANNSYGLIKLLGPESLKKN